MSLPAFKPHFASLIDNPKGGDLAMDISDSNPECERATTAMMDHLRMIYDFLLFEERPDLFSRVIRTLQELAEGAIWLLHNVNPGAQMVLDALDREQLVHSRLFSYGISRYDITLQGIDFLRCGFDFKKLSWVCKNTGIYSKRSSVKSINALFIRELKREVVAERRSREAVAEIKNTREAVHQDLCREFGGHVSRENVEA